MRECGIHLGQVLGGERDVGAVDILLALRFSISNRDTMRKSPSATRVVDLAGQQALAGRAERQGADRQSIQQRQNLPLGFAPEQRIFALQRRDGAGCGPWSLVNAVAWRG
jgi:hypothetical protein